MRRRTVKIQQQIDGPIAKQGQSRANLTSVQAIFIIANIADPKDPIFNRPVSAQISEHLRGGKVGGELLQTIALFPDSANRADLTCGGNV